jgi:hypothetical protein
LAGSLPVFDRPDPTHCGRWGATLARPKLVLGRKAQAPRNISGSGVFADYTRFYPIKDGKSARNGSS